MDTKRKCLLVVCAALFLCVVLAQEKVVFDSAILTDAGATTFGVAAVSFNWETPQVQVKLRECDANGQFITGGRVKHVTVTGHQAAVAVGFLEKANFTSISFKTRLITWLQNNGHLGSGAISGTPQTPTTTTTSTTLP
jgi:hypothetical protein